MFGQLADLYRLFPVPTARQRRLFAPGDMTADSSDAAVLADLAQLKLDEVRWCLHVLLPAAAPLSAAPPA